MPVLEPCGVAATEYWVLGVFTVPEQPLAGQETAVSAIANGAEVAEV